MKSSGDMSRDKRLKKHIFLHIFHKSKKHPSKPCRPNFYKISRTLLVGKQTESTLPDSISGCLSADERLNAQIYGQLKREHVCVGICLPLCI